MPSPQAHRNRGGSDLPAGIVLRREVTGSSAVREAHCRASRRDLADPVGAVSRGGADAEAVLHSDADALERDAMGVGDLATENRAWLEGGIGNRRVRVAAGNVAPIVLEQVVPAIAA